MGRESVVLSPGSLHGRVLGSVVEVPVFSS